MITRMAQVAAVLAGWLAVLVLVTRFASAAPAVVVVLFPGEGLLAHLPQGTAITGRSAAGVTVRSDDPDLVAQLYQAGAWLVLPAGLAGCLALPAT
jgi:hypothetical protein